MTKLPEQQKNILYDMKKLIDTIRSARIYTGEDPKNHSEIWQEIYLMYNKLDYNHQEKFNDFMEGK